MNTTNARRSINAIAQPTQTDMSPEDLYACLDRVIDHMLDNRLITQHWNRLALFELSQKGLIKGGNLKAFDKLERPVKSKKEALKAFSDLPSPANLTKEEPKEPGEFAYRSACGSAFPCDGYHQNLPLLLGYLSEKAECCLRDFIGREENTPGAAINTWVGTAAHLKLLRVALPGMSMPKLAKHAGIGENSSSWAYLEKTEPVTRRNGRITTNTSLRADVWDRLLIGIVSDMSQTFESNGDLTKTWSWFLTDLLSWSTYLYDFMVHRQACKTLLSLVARDAEPFLNKEKWSSFVSENSAAPPSSVVPKDRIAKVLDTLAEHSNVQPPSDSLPMSSLLTHGIPDEGDWVYALRRELPDGRITGNPEGATQQWSLSSTSYAARMSLCALLIDVVNQRRELTASKTKSEGGTQFGSVEDLQDNLENWVDQLPETEIVSLPDGSFAIISTTPSELTMGDWIIDVSGEKNLVGIMPLADKTVAVSTPDRQYTLPQGSITAIGPVKFHIKKCG